MSEQADDKRRDFEKEALVHLDALFGLALRLTGGDEPRAQDLVQDAILKAFRSWDRFEPGTNCRAWLMTILRNTFINEFRKTKARPVPLEYDLVADRPSSDGLFAADPSGEIFDRVMDGDVVRAIQDLPEEFRIPVILSDLQGLSYQEVADLMDIPVGTVKSRLFRARKRLQQALYEYGVEMGYVR
jgi:RNA polymerase sigma-70 factor (ECF subfamily)